MTLLSVAFPNDRELKPEAIIAKWKDITTFGELDLSLLVASFN
jgi:hypothetical protein